MFKDSKSTQFPEAEAFKRYLIIIGIILLAITLLLVSAAYTSGKMRRYNVYQNLSNRNLTTEVSSRISGFQAGLPVKSAIERNDSTIRFFATNVEPLYLFKKAMNLQPEAWPNSYVIFDHVDELRFLMIEPQEDWPQKSITYELSIPLERKKELNSFILHDLCRYFKVNARIQERETDCYMLVKESAVKLPFEKDAKRENNFKTGQGQPYFMKNSPLSDLVRQLNEEPAMLPVFDTTGITQNVDLELGSDLTSIFLLNQQLKKYGLALKFSTRRMPVLVLSPASL